MARWREVYELSLWTQINNKRQGESKHSTFPHASYAKTWDYYSTLPVRQLPLFSSSKRRHEMMHVVTGFTTLRTALRVSVIICVWQIAGGFSRPLLPLDDQISRSGKQVSDKYLVKPPRHYKLRLCYWTCACFSDGDAIDIARAIWRLKQWSTSMFVMVSWLGCVLVRLSHISGNWCLHSIDRLVCTLTQQGVSNRPIIWLYSSPLIGERCAASPKNGIHDRPVARHAGTGVSWSKRSYRSWITTARCKVGPQREKTWSIRSHRCITCCCVIWIPLCSNRSSADFTTPNELIDCATFLTVIIRVQDQPYLTESFR